MTDASLTDKAATALDSAADDAAKATSKAADSAEAAVNKAADRATDAVESGARSVEKTADKAVDTVAQAADKADSAVDRAAAKADKAVDKAADKLDTADGSDVAADAPAVPARTVDEIEADLAATRDRLAGRLDDLQSYVSPRNVADRQMAKVKAVFVDEYGGIKPDRVLMAVGVVVALVGIRVLRRRHRSA